VACGQRNSQVTPNKSSRFNIRIFLSSTSICSCAGVIAWRAWRVRFYARQSSEMRHIRIKEVRNFEIAEQNSAKSIDSLHEFVIFDEN
jgi:hypothetical protein